MLKEQINALKSMSASSVEAGWFESARYPAGDGKAGRSVAANARVQEFGEKIEQGNTTITIPARPFMRLAWSMFRQDRSAIQLKVAGKIVRGKIDARQALAQIGLELEGCIVKSIRDGQWEPNAKSTVRGKGFDKPLIDSALMWQSVSSKVY